MFTSCSVPFLTQAEANWSTPKALSHHYLPMILLLSTWSQLWIPSSNLAFLWGRSKPSNYLLSQSFYATAVLFQDSHLSEPAHTSHLWLHAKNLQLFHNNSVSFTAHLNPSPSSPRGSFYCFHDRHPRGASATCHLDCACVYLASFQQVIFSRCHSDHATHFATACQVLPIALRIKTRFSAWVVWLY